MSGVDRPRRLAGMGEPAVYQGARPLPTGPAPSVGLLQRFPPRPVPGGWAMTVQPKQQVISRLLAAPFAAESAHLQRDRRRGLIRVLGWLEQQPGDTWQDRWITSGADAEGNGHRGSWSAPLCRSGLAPNRSPWRASPPGGAPAVRTWGAHRPCTWRFSNLPVCQPLPTRSPHTASCSHTAGRSGQSGGNNVKTSRITRGRLAGLAAVAVLAGALGGPPAHATAPTTEVKPAALPRGASPETVHLNTKTEVLWDVDDQPIQLDVPGDARSVQRLSHKRFLVTSWVPDTDTQWIMMFNGAGDRTIVSRWLMGHFAVSPDRTRIAFDTVTPGGDTLVQVKDLRTARLLAQRRFPGDTGTVAYAGAVLLGRRDAGLTLKWFPFTNTVREFARAAAYRADVDANRVALYFHPSGRDVYPCTRVVSLSGPREHLWQSCDLSVTSWSPAGDRVLAVLMTSDGCCNSQWMVARAATGAVERTFTGTLLNAEFERNDRVLLTAIGPGQEKAAVVRCLVNGHCDRSTRLFPVAADPDQPVPIIITGR